MFINTDHYISTLHYIIPYYMFSCFLLTFKSTSMFIAVTSDRSNQVIIFYVSDVVLVSQQIVYVDGVS